MKKLMKKLTGILLVAAIILSSAVTPAFQSNAAGTDGESVSSATARDMRFLTVDGNVNVINPAGKISVGKTGTRLFNGFKVDTSEASYAWIDLDKSKVIKLDAITETEVREKGKELELLLNAGNMFFNVSEKLKTEETLNIRTSTMVTGIRGTSGWVKVMNEYLTELFLIEGEVTVIVTDPVTGEQKSVIMHAGDMAEIWVYDKDHAGSKCDILMRKFHESDIEGFVAQEIKKDKNLQDRIRATGLFDVNQIIYGADEQLKKDQEAVRRAMKAITEAALSQYIETIVDPVFGKYTTNGTPIRDGGSNKYNALGGGSTGGSGSSGSDPEPEKPTSITLDLAVAASLVNQYLNVEKLNVILNGNGANNVFTVDSNVTIPAGLSLKLVNATTSVASGSTLTNNGTLESDVTTTAGATYNNNGHQDGSVDASAGGTINNTSKDTITGDVRLGELAELVNSGAINGTVSLTDFSKLTNSGSIAEVAVLETNASLENLSGGTIDRATVLAGASTNAGTIGTYEGSGVFTNTGSITNGVTIGTNVGGQFNNSGTVSGGVTVLDQATFNNNAGATVNGRIEVNGEYAEFNNGNGAATAGTINTTDTITVNGGRAQFSNQNGTLNTTSAPVVAAGNGTLVTIANSTVTISNYDGFADLERNNLIETQAGSDATVYLGFETEDPVHDEASKSVTFNLGDY